MEQHCKFCRTLEPYTGVFRNNMFLRADLTVQMDIVKLTNNPGTILMCPECGDYYYYLVENIPSRSEKALTPKMFQTFYKLSAFHLFLLLYPNVTPKQKDYIYFFSEIVLDEAIRYLKNEPGPQNACPVSHDSPNFYNNISQIIINLFNHCYNDDIELIVKLVGLFKLKNDTVSEIISESLYSTLTNFKQDYRIVEEILQKLEQIFPKNSELKRLAERVRLKFEQTKETSDKNKNSTAEVKLTLKQKKQVIDQMKEKSWVIKAPENKQTKGKNVSYSYNKKIKRFIKSESDNAVPAFYNETRITQAEMIEVLSYFSISQIINEGFEI